ncbi:MAG: MerR family transcriptional regulator [Chloroflexia bacterium]
MFKIGEFSHMAQVSVRMLRHYDEMGLLKPAHVDRWTDYRYYALEQLPTLHRILALKDLGCSLEQIADLVRKEVPAAQLRELLAQKQVALHRQIEGEKARLQRLETRIRQIERGDEQATYEVVLKKVPAMTMATVQKMVPHVSDMATYRCAMYGTLYRTLEQARLETRGPEYALYRNDAYTERNIFMEAAVGIERTDADLTEGEVSLRILPEVEELASVMHRGRLEDVGFAIVALYRWMGANGYQAGESYREVHLFGRENDLLSFDDVVVEMQLPVHRTGDQGIDSHIM